MNAEEYFKEIHLRDVDDTIKIKVSEICEFADSFRNKSEYEILLKYHIWLSDNYVIKYTNIPGFIKAYLNE